MNILEDEINLRLLRYLVSGNGVMVNVRAMAKKMGVHRATVQRKINLLYSSKILNPPFYSFPQLYIEYPLLVLVKADMPRSLDIKEFFIDDSHIFAAFSCMEGPYNTFLIEFFRDLESYHSWREQIVIDRKIPSRETRVPADANIFSNKLTFKYDPNCFFKNFKNEFEKNKVLILNNIEIDSKTFEILDFLMNGIFIQRNDSYLARELELNRKTVKKRVETLLNEKIISSPKCYFPNLFIPPGYNLVVSLIEVKSCISKIKEYFYTNNNISRAQDASTGRYNFLIFSAFKTFEDFFVFGEELIAKFPEAIGGISNLVLSSRMIHTIKPQKLSLGWIERKLWQIKQNT
jgi:DNA-binding Lrp family transcriptional regulator/predicted regulator of amino acid metabolism with ACT domain